MRILYIDESHSKSFYVLSGALINDTGFEKFYVDFNNFLDKELGLNVETELKGDELWNGRGYWGKIKMEDRANFVEKIAQYLKTTKLKLIVAFTNTSKANDHEKYFKLLPKIIEEGVKITSRESGSTKKHLMVIFDERADLRKDYEVYNAIAQKKVDIVKNFKGTCKIFDYGYEGISKFSRVLQVADFVAYFYRAYLEIKVFSESPDTRKLDLLKRIFENYLKGKVILKKVK